MVPSSDSFLNGSIVPLCSLDVLLRRRVAHLDGWCFGFRVAVKGFLELVVTVDFGNNEASTPVDSYDFIHTFLILHSVC